MRRGKERATLRGPSAALEGRELWFDLRVDDATGPAKADAVVAAVQA